MKLIKPSFTILHQAPGLEGVYKQIELAGRTCYKSEDKITPDSAKAFVDRMIASGHGAMLEHGTVYLMKESEFIHTYIHPEGKEKQKYNPLLKYYNNKYSYVRQDYTNTGLIYVTTNLRVLVENGWMDDLKYICEPTEYHEKRVCVKFICDRGVSHEFVRHRVFSFAQESTRYVGSSSMKPITEFDCNNSSDICEAYKQGFSMKNISDNSSLSEYQVRKILIDNNIEIRGLNNKGNRIEDYFYNIDTPEKAYLLGIIQTDGSVRLSNENAALTITQHKDYAWYIETMLLNFSDKICTTKDRNCLQMLIGSKSIVNDLINCGIVPNKTKLQTNEDVIRLWEVVPEEFKGDFIRGCIDGDGHVTFFTQKGATNESCNIGFCSIKELLIDKIIELIFDKFNYRCGKGKDGNIYKLWITDYKKAMEIGRFIFQNFQYPFGHPKKASTWIERLGCNYQIADYKDPKFQIIEPTWLSESSPQSIFTFMNALNYSEDAYSKLRLGGWKPQEARAVLPNVLKTELVMTGFYIRLATFF